MDLHDYFERVVVVSLRRRPDRLKSFQAELEQCDWPFRPPVVFPAIDGSVVPAPDGWQSGSGAWGCMRSHQAVFEQAMMDNIGSLLVLEDDACFAPDFGKLVHDFLGEVPDDWDQLMLGGQHTQGDEVPTSVKPGILRCNGCERTHCYAIRAPFIKTLYRRWLRGGEFNGEVHCDWIMARDPEMQCMHRVYAPERFLVGQCKSKSDVNGSIQPRKFWNPPNPDLPVIFLKTSPAIVDDLRQFGIHTGHSRDCKTGVDKKLAKLFSDTTDDLAERIVLLKKWIIDIQWEVASDPYLICAVWHPEATMEMVAAASRGPVFEISGSDAEQIIDAMPGVLRRPIRPVLARIGLIFLESPKRVIDVLRTAGWYPGSSIDEGSGLNVELLNILDHQLTRSQMISAIREFINKLQDEADGIYNGIAVIWHPNIDIALLQSAAPNRIFKIGSSSNIVGRRGKWQ